MQSLGLNLELAQNCRKVNIDKGLSINMAQCPCCGKMFEGERGASVHLHYCPKRTDSSAHSKEQVSRRRKEVRDVFNSKLRWRMKPLSISKTKKFSKSLQ